MTEFQIKAAVRERDGHCCTKCGMTHQEHVQRHGRILHVHRLIPGSAYSVDGCVTLCVACHGPEPKLPPGAKKAALDAAGFYRSPRKVFHLPEALDNAFNAYIASLPHKPNESEILRDMLQEFLQRHGFWPPKPDKTKE